MAFIMTELVTESILRDGFTDMVESIGRENDQIEDIFAELKAPYLNNKYGEKEIKRIKEMVKDGIRIVHGYGLNEVDLPLISINITNNNEMEQYAGMDDFADEIDTPIDQSVIVDTFTADSGNTSTGVIKMNAANPNLALVRVGNVFVDGDGAEFVITGGISNEVGDKRVGVNPTTFGALNPVDCRIVSALANERRTVRQVHDSENVLLSIMSKEPLITKYIYTMVKYILVTRKYDMALRCTQLPTFDGTDFHRTEWMPDGVWARFINLKFKLVGHSWNAEKVNLIDSVGGAIKVIRDEFPRDDEETLTVKTIPEEDC